MTALREDDKLHLVKDINSIAVAARVEEIAAELSLSSEKHQISIRALNHIHKGMLDNARVAGLLTELAELEHVAGMPNQLILVEEIGSRDPLGIPTIHDRIDVIEDDIEKILGAEEMRSRVAAGPLHLSAVLGLGKPADEERKLGLDPIDGHVVAARRYEFIDLGDTVRMHHEPAYAAFVAATKAIVSRLCRWSPEIAMRLETLDGRDFVVAWGTDDEVAVIAGGTVVLPAGLPAELVGLLPSRVRYALMRERVMRLAA